MATTAATVVFLCRVREASARKSVLLFDVMMERERDRESHRRKEREGEGGTRVGSEGPACGLCRVVRVGPGRGGSLSAHALPARFCWCATVGQ